MTWEYRGLQGVTRGYRGLQGVRRGYRGLQRVTGGYKGLQGVTGSDKVLQGVTKDYRNFFLTKLKLFHLLCLSKIDREKVFADVLDKKEAFKDYKNKCIQKTQNSKGVSPSFWSNI